MKSLFASLNTIRVRSYIIQAVVVLSIFLVIVLIVLNMITNMRQRGIPLGLDFLDSETGFSVLQSLIEYTELSSYAKLFLVGILNTILVSVIGLVLTTIIGFTVGIARLSNNWLMKKLTISYIEIFRNLPILLQILFWNSIFRQILPTSDNPFSIGENIHISLRGIFFPKLTPNALFFVMLAVLVLLIIAFVVIRKYAVNYLNRTGKIFPVWRPTLIAMGLYGLVFLLLFDNMFAFENPVATRFGFDKGTSVILELFILSFSLAVYTATYIAEQVRASIEAVDKGQKEAAAALGLKPFMMLRYIVIPQALRIIIPPLTNLYLNLVKNSSLATAIGYPDLVAIFAGTALNQSGRAIEIMFLTMAVYLSLSLLISFLMNWYNRSVKLIER